MMRTDEVKVSGNLEVVPSSLQCLQMELASNQECNKSLRSGATSKNVCETMARLDSYPLDSKENKSSLGIYAKQRAKSKMVAREV